MPDAAHVGGPGIVRCQQVTVPRENCVRSAIGQDAFHIGIFCIAGGSRSGVEITALAGVGHLATVFPGTSSRAQSKRFLQSGIRHPNGRRVRVSRGSPNLDGPCLIPPCIANHSLYQSVNPNISIKTRTYGLARNDAKNSSNVSATPTVKSAYRTSSQPAFSQRKYSRCAS
jgi:hypothetical protein